MMVLAALKLNTADDTSSLRHVVNDARHFMRSISQPKLTCTRGETNKVAQRLVRLGLTLDQRIIWFEEHINVITDLLLENSTTL